MLDSVSSVLDVAHELGAAGADTGTLVLSDEQTRGRGRAGRAWFSPKGAGIWLALLLKPRDPPVGGALAIRAGLAIIEALRARSGALPVALKWPNDVVMGGLKAGGILCEARWNGARLGWVAVGIGLNVHGPVDPQVAHSAVALAQRDPGISRAAILKELVPRLIGLDERPPALEPEERVQFLRRLWMAPGSGTVVGLDADGALLLRRTNGSLERRTMPD